MSSLPGHPAWRTAATLITVAALLLAPPAVLAHAELVTSEPAAGSTVDVAPDAIVLTFNGPIVADRSSFVVEGPGGEVGRGGVDPDAPDTMVLAAPRLQPGTYQVRWTAVADDGHNEIRRDTFVFSIAEPTLPPATPTPAASPSATASPAPAASSPASSSTVAPLSSPTASSAGPAGAGGTGTDALLPIIVALAVLAGIGAWLVRRSRAG